MAHFVPGTTAILTIVIGVHAATLSSAAAQPIPVGAEFQVNSYTTGSQSSAKVAANPDGTAFVIWRDSSARDGDGFGVFGRLIAANGSPLGEDFQINTTTSQSQSKPVIASDGVGDFVAAWQSVAQDGDSFGVAAQRFAGDGNPIGTEFLVNTATTGSQNSPQVGAAADGRFVVVFVDDNYLDGDRRGIFARCYDAGGAPMGDQFQVNAYTTGFQDDPQAAMASDGSFLVAWKSDLNNHRDGDAQSIVARRFDTQCDPAGDDFVVNSYTTGNQVIASVTALADKGFVLLWDSTGQDGDDIGVFAQRLDADGNPFGDETQVNAYTTGLQYGGRAAQQDDGTVVVSWTSDLQDGDGYGVYSRAFGNSGQSSDEIRVNSTTAGEQSGPAIATTGGFLVVWSDQMADGDNFGIFAQRFDLPTSTTTTTLDNSTTTTLGVTTTTTMPPGAACADPTGGGITATDALFVLQAAIGLQSCAQCICDVDGGGSVSATDALVTLQLAVGTPNALDCPAC